MNNLDLLIDLHLLNPRQGPGDDEQTALALRLSGVDTTALLRVAEIGCGTGAATLALARLLPQAQITAVDKKTGKSIVTVQGGLPSLGKRR